MKNNFTNRNEAIPNPLYIKRSDKKAPNLPSQLFTVSERLVNSLTALWSSWP